MSVVSFPKREEPDAIFVCNCGCASFELHADGRATCRACMSIADDGGWKVRRDGDASFEGQHIYSDGGNADDFAERRVKREATKADWIIFGTYEGRIVSWSREFVDTPEREAWLRDHVDEGLKNILEDKP